MSAKDIEQYQMKKGTTLNPNGRPPKLLTRITKELILMGYERVRPTNIIEAYETMLGLDEAKIKDIIADDKHPMIMRIVGKAMLSKQGFEMLEKMLDRVHGKAVQKTEIGGGLKITKEIINNIENTNQEPDISGDSTISQE